MALAAPNTDADPIAIRDDDLDPSSLLTIVVVTSPIESNPSTELIDRCISSIIRTWPCLVNCKIVIAADGCLELKEENDDVQEGNGVSYNNSCKSRRKRVFGKATTSQIQQYNGFLDRLELRSWLTVSRPNKVEEENSGSSSLSTEWLGFALTLRKAIENHVETPLVLVTPHDYELIIDGPLQDVSVQTLINAILDSDTTTTIGSNNHPINYIGLHNAKTLTLSQRNASVLKDLPSMSLETSIDSNTSLLLQPLPTWKENPHFASVQAYHDVVFDNPKYHKFKNGHFIEDTLGQKMLQTLKDNNRNNPTQKKEIFASFGTFLLEIVNASTTMTTDEEEQRRPCTFHTNGIKYVAMDEYELRGYHPPKTFHLERSRDAKRFVSKMGSNL